MQTTRDDFNATQSQLWDQQSGVGIEPLIFELETEEPNPLAITAITVVITTVVCPHALMSLTHWISSHKDVSWLRQRMLFPFSGGSGGTPPSGCNISLNSSSHTNHSTHFFISRSIFRIQPQVANETSKLASKCLWSCSVFLESILKISTILGSNGRKTAKFGRISDFRLKSC